MTKISPESDPKKSPRPQHGERAQVARQLLVSIQVRQRRRLLRRRALGAGRTSADGANTCVDLFNVFMWCIIVEHICDVFTVCRMVPTL